MAAYISEIAPVGDASQEFIEIAVDSGTDMSGYSIAIYENSGALVGTISLGSVDNTVAGKDVYVIDNSHADFQSTYSAGNLWEGDGVALVDDTGAVLQFVSYRGYSVTADNGPASGMTSTDLGFVNFGESLQSDNDGSSYFQQIEPNAGTVPCYAAGVLIGTPDGPRRVETLAPGDQIVTPDHGPLPVLWVRQSVHDLQRDLADTAPVLIRAGALAPGLPATDLIVSPQHRILAGEQGQLAGYFDRPYLVPAKALTDVPGIRRMNGKRNVIWCHFALSRHAIVRANGCYTESLLLGPMVLQGMPTRDRAALARLFPAKASGDRALNGQPARNLLRVGEARKRIRAQKACHDLRVA
ncbi:MAG: Hint domain-containing protein [Pseudomonadota bacterium]